MRHRPPTVVLWGGRPGVDYQAGSYADRRRQAQLRTARAMRQIGEAFKRTAAAMAARVHAFTELERAHLAAQITSEADERNVILRAMRAHR